ARLNRPLFCLWSGGFRSGFRSRDKQLAEIFAGMPVGMVAHRPHQAEADVIATFLAQRKTRAAQNGHLMLQAVAGMGNVVNATLGDWLLAAKNFSHIYARIPLAQVSQVRCRGADGELRV